MKKWQMWLIIVMVLTVVGGAGYLGAPKWAGGGERHPSSPDDCSGDPGRCAADGHCPRPVGQHAGGAAGLRG